ncbi:hypothetical protein [Pseudomonas aeruginosa]|uniref:hypothetical protein n=1 Tax=Pseudomonas aeruginosa TaxID=287 RepID=UPI00287F9416|nr:hypothetical protein [Pseudomonas aeruginosa]
MYEKYFHKYRSVQASETMAAIFRKLVIVGAAIRSWQFVANSSLLRATALGPDRVKTQQAMAINC